ncbi:hypothetical protein AVEN_250446-1, partial [Araneus ventricosus]
MEPIVRSRIVSLAKVRDWRWIVMISFELVENHNQELTTEGKLMELHCVQSKKLWREFVRGLHLTRYSTDVNALVALLECIRL